MSYSKKLQLFFKARGISQKEASETLGFSRSMIGRYFAGTDRFPPEFIVALVKHYPEIDLQYIFSEQEEINNCLIEEPKVKYSKKKMDVLKELSVIESKVAEIKQFLINNTKT